MKLNLSQKLYDEKVREAVKGLLMKKRLQVFLIFTLGSLFTGCQGYWADRGRDWMDIGTLTLDYGKGFGAHVQVTDIFRLGYESKTTWRLGASGRMTGFWRENREAWSAGPLGENYLDIREVYCVGVEHWNALTNQGLYPSAARVFTRQRYVISGGGSGLHYRDRTFADIGYSLHLGIIGISHDFRPTEFIDFILGFFGEDIAQDDWPDPESHRYR